MRFFCALVFVIFGVFSAAQADTKIDGVPIPDDFAPLSSNSSPFSGIWVGNWDASVKTLLALEKLEPNGRAKVLYAYGENPGRFEGGWARLEADLVDDQLFVRTKRSKMVFSLSGSGRVRGVFGNDGGFAVLEKITLDDLKDPGADRTWGLGNSEFVETNLSENASAIALEVAIFKPQGKGPFPLAVINHGSTGKGLDEGLRKETWVNPWLADVLNEKGWIVAFPQRRGRGNSDGLYDEGFSERRSEGYSCEADKALPGYERALEDLQAAVVELQKRKDVQQGPILLSGLSRGGALSIAYAGKYPDQTLGVINFVGGWISSGCGDADEINRTILGQGTDFKGQTLWLYGFDDTFYAEGYANNLFQSFLNGGGQGSFFEHRVAGENNGHWVMSVPSLWSEKVNSYLESLKK